MSKQYKIALIGPPCSGKSTWLQRYRQGICNNNYHRTIGVDIHPVVVYTEDSMIYLNVWDCAGQCLIDGCSNAYYHDTDGVISMYDDDSEDVIEEYERDVIDVVRRDIPILRIHNKVVSDDPYTDSFDVPLSRTRDIFIRLVEMIHNF